MGSWETYVRRVTPYVPGEQPREDKIVKLNTNENPYPPSPRVREALAGLQEEGLRRYPDPGAGRLVAALAEAYGVSKDRIFVGVGSDDVLAMCFLTFFQSDKPILFPDISYSFYSVWANLFRIPYRKQSLTDSFEINPEDYKQENGGIIFPNPNAPTGLLLGRGGLEEILEANPDSLVIVDEAYIDFAPDGSSALPLTSRYENLLVVQTFSKSRSLAGMRVGFAIGSPRVIAYLADCKYSFNSYTMNQPSLLAGEAAAKDTGWYRETARRVIATRDHAKEVLGDMGFTFPDSQANFLFVRHQSVRAADLFRDLRKAGIVVRYFNQPRIDDYLRITIGTDGEMEDLYTFLRTYLSRA